MIMLCLLSILSFLRDVISWDGVIEIGLLELDKCCNNQPQEYVNTQHIWIYQLIFTMRFNGKSSRLVPEIQ
jgi:hypothetical protein